MALTNLRTRRKMGKCEGCNELRSEGLVLSFHHLSQRPYELSSQEPPVYLQQSSTGSRHFKVNFRLIIHELLVLSLEQLIYCCETRSRNIAQSNDQSHMIMAHMVKGVFYRQINSNQYFYRQLLKSIERTLEFQLKHQNWS